MIEGDKEWKEMLRLQPYRMIARLLTDVQELKNKIYGLEEELMIHKMRPSHPDI